MLIAGLLGLTPDATAQTLSISAPTDAVEGHSGATNRYFRITLSASRPNITSISVCFSGTATRDTSTNSYDPGDDYAPQNITILVSGACINTFVPANATTYDAIGIRVFGDTDIESDETVTATVSLLGDSPVTLGTSTATHTITNDDTHHVTVAVTNSADTTITGVDEGDIGHTDYTVTLHTTPAYSSAFQVDLCLTGTATRGATADYELLAPGGGAIHLGIAADGCLVAGAQLGTIGGSVLAGQYTLRVHGDTTIEQNKTVILTVKANVVTPDDIISFGPAVTFTVRNDDLPEVTISGGAAVTEGNNANFTVTATPTPASGLVVGLQVTDPGNFIGGNTSRLVTVSPVTGQAIYAPRTQDDSIDEPDGILTTTILAGNGYTIGTPGSAMVTVNDNDDSLPVITLTRTSAASLTEGNSATFRVTATPAPTANLNVTVNLADDATADYLAPAQQGDRIVTIPTAGQMSFTVVTVGDQIDEPDGTVTATVQTGTGYTVGDPASATVTVTDNDVPAITVTGPTSITEGDTATFTVTANPTPHQSLTVTLLIADSGAFAHSGQTGTKTVTVPTGGTVTQTVTTQNDSTDEANGVLTATVQTGTGYTVGSPGSAMITVTDNDVPAITVTGPTSITEGQDAVFTVTADPTPHQSLTVTLLIADSGAFAHSGQTGTKTVTVPTGGTVTQTVTTQNDSTDEANGVLTATVQTGTGYTVGSPGSAMITVNDNDDPPPATPVIRVTATPANPTEGDTVTVTVTATPPPTANLPVTLTIHGGTFAPSGQRTVTVPPAGTTTLTVTTMDDTTDEANGPVIVTVDTGPGYAIHNTQGSVTVTVRDDDDPAPTTDRPDDGAADNGSPATDADPAVPTPPPVTLTVSAAPVTEGQSLSVTLRRTPATGAWTVTWRTADGSATAAADYVPQSGTLAFAPGSATAALTVATLDDAIDEDDETVRLHLTAPGLPPQTVTATLRDNDTAGLTVSPRTLRLAAGGEGRYTIRLHSQPTAAVTVTVNATDPDRLTPAPRQLTIVPERWQQPHAVTVTAGPPGDQTLIHQLASADPRYAALSPPVLPVTVIEDLAPIASPWLLRAVRSQADPVLDRIAERTRTRPPAGLRLQLAGQTIDPRSASHNTPRDDVMATGRTVAGRDALAGAAFTLGMAPQVDGSRWTVWGQGDWGRFEGRHENTLALDGETVSATLGLDRRHGLWQGGLALSVGTGEGNYQHGDGRTGQLDSTLTLAVPWAAWRLTDRFTVWGAWGHGRGTVTLTPDGRPARRTDTEAALAATGLRTVLRRIPAAGGLGLDLTAEARWLETTLKRADFVLDDTEAELTRWRLALEGTWHTRRTDRRALSARLALGLRADRGDAETGGGVELGSGLTWRDPHRGLDLTVRGRTLLTHGDTAVREHGLSLALDWAPVRTRGPSLTVSQTWGVSEDGLDRLLGPDPLDHTATDDPAPQLRAEAAWRRAFGDGRFISEPYLGLGVGSQQQDLRLGWRRVAPTATPLTLDLAIARLSQADQPPEHRIGLVLGGRW